jgi:hypothetical protein
MIVNYIEPIYQTEGCICFSEWLVAGNIWSYEYWAPRQDELGDTNSGRDDGMSLSCSGRRHLLKTYRVCLAMTETAYAGTRSINPRAACGDRHAGVIQCFYSECSSLYTCTTCVRKKKKGVEYKGV